jgi:hypothetical protein
MVSLCESAKDLPSSQLGTREPLHPASIYRSLVNFPQRILIPRGQILPDLFEYHRGIASLILRTKLADS